LVEFLQNIKQHFIIILPVTYYVILSCMLVIINELYEHVHNNGIHKTFEKKLLPFYIIICGTISDNYFYIIKISMKMIVLKCTSLSSLCY